MILLLVDDEEITRSGLIQNIPWSDLGIKKILQAKDGVEGLHYAQKNYPDLILTDVKMPRLSGIEMACEIRKQKPFCPIIFMSGYSDKIYLKSAIKLQAVDYVEKPIQLEEVTQAIQSAIKIYSLKTTVRNNLPWLPSSFTEDFLTLDKFIQKKDNPLIQMIVGYIKKNYISENLSVRTISQYVYLSTTYVCTLFKSETTSTINQYITQYRLFLAQQMLQDPRIKINHISQHVGYSDGNYFSKSFKKAIGLSPSEYRELFAKNAQNFNTENTKEWQDTSNV